MARVLIGIPTGKGFVWAPVADALARLDHGGHEVVQECFSFYKVEEARNRMARKAVRDGFDYLFMVDDDTIVPKDALTTLISDDVDVVMGHYIMSGSDDLTPMTEPRGNNYRVYHSEAEIAEMRDDGMNLVEIGGGGMGCALVKVSALKALTDPWFKYVSFKDDDELSEDYYFCHQCRSIRMKVYMDTRVGCDHLKLQWKKAL